MSQTNESKIRAVLEKIDPILKESNLSDAEFLVLVANFLFGLGSNGIKMFSKINDLKITDANAVEIAYLNHPENVYLAALLQSHALIKWSENLK